MADYKMKWIAYVVLKKDGAYFTLPDADFKKIPEKGPGVYIFCRKHGSTFSPQYVGRSRRLRRRIEEHLNSVRLMKALATGEIGQRVILVSQVERQKGLSPENVTKAVESLLIRKFLAEGYELLNEMGTKRRMTTVRWRGTNDYLDLVPREMHL